MSLDEVATELDAVTLCAGGLVLRYDYTFDGRTFANVVTVPWAAVRAIGHCDDDCLWLDIDARPENRVRGYLPYSRYCLQTPEAATTAADVASELTAAWEVGVMESLGGSVAEWDKPVADGGGWIEDGYGNEWPMRCPDCGALSMEVVRPGKAQCGRCENG